jgi:hypothetical protein
LLTSDNWHLASVICPRAQSIVIPILASITGEYDATMDKPKQRGTNRPKGTSPGRQEKRIVEAIGARRRADQTRHSAGARPVPPDTKMKSRQGKPANPLKDEGTSKGRAREIIDKARNVQPRTGGSRRGASHPGQRGGIKADLGPSQMRQDERRAKRSGERSPGLDARENTAKRPGRRIRTGTSRSGDEARRRARGGSRRRGRASNRT